MAMFTGALTRRITGRHIHSKFLTPAIHPDNQALDLFVAVFKHRRENMRSLKREFALIERNMVAKADHYDSKREAQRFKCRVETVRLVEIEFLHSPLRSPVARVRNTDTRMKTTPVRRTGESPQNENDSSVSHWSRGVKKATQL